MQALQIPLEQTHSHLKDKTISLTNHKNSKLIDPYYNNIILEPLANLRENVNISLSTLDKKMISEFL